MQVINLRPLNELQRNDPVLVQVGNRWIPATGQDTSLVYNKNQRTNLPLKPSPSQKIIYTRRDVRIQHITNTK